MPDFKYLKVKVEPNSKKAKVSELDNDRFLIHTKSKAEANQANQEMLQLLADHLLVSRSDLQLVGGHHHPSKMVRMALVD